MEASTITSVSTIAQCIPNAHHRITPCSKSPPIRPLTVQARTRKQLHHHPRLRSGILFSLDQKNEDTVVLTLTEEKNRMPEEKWTSSRWIGIASLLAVAFMWGSYAPVLKFIFASIQPPLASTLSFIKASISTAVMCISLSLIPAPRKANIEGSKDQSGNWIGQWLTWNSGSLLLSAVELGIWDACGTFAQTSGVSMTSPTNAAFLIHTVTVFTPLLSSFTGDRLGSLGWLGSALSIVGCLFVAVDLSSMDSFVTLSVGNGGDCLTIMAAVFYSISTVRVGTLVRDFSPRELALGNALVTLCGATIWTIIDLKGMDGDVDALWPGYAQLVPWIAILWASIGPDTLASVLRNAGQRIMPPSRAQLIYATTPFWSVAIASQVLHLDTMRTETWIGGGLILFSALISTFD